VKKIIAALMSTFLVAAMFMGCKREPVSEYTKYNDTFFDTFDTMIMVIAYTKTEEEFKTNFERIEKRFLELHELYDIYNNYEGISNIKTINDNAGIKPVKVNKEIIDLIKFSNDWAKRTGNHTNIAMGAVLKIWHDYRDAGKDDPDNAKIPSMDQLKEAEKHTDINKVIVDANNSTFTLRIRM
jgi:thiamine biosynthesis lipoprotein